MLRAVLVDDEPLARERLRRLLGEAEVEVDILGEAPSGMAAVPMIHEARPDVVFLDVQMPRLDGFDVVDLLAEPRPHIVFVTAYDAFALRAFEVHALDYLTKPVRSERLARSLRRVADLVALRRSDDGVRALAASRQAEPLRLVPLHVGRHLRVVEPAEILYFEARDKLVFAHTDGRNHMVDFTLQVLEDRLQAAGFVRVHRSYLVNPRAIRELIPWFSGTYQLRLSGGATLPVARRRVRDVKALLR